MSRTQSLLSIRNFKARVKVFQRCDGLGFVGPVDGLDYAIIIRI